MSVSKVHYCLSQEMISQGRDEPPARKCRCRKHISLSEATKKVKHGEARWVVLKRVYETKLIPCPMCFGDKEVKNCAQCGGSGQKAVMQAVEEYGNDIVYGSSKPVDRKEKKYRPTLAMKTPRVPTIESEHIERWVVYGVKEAGERIEEYGRLVKDALMFVGKDRHPMIKPEPLDDPATGTGRKYDWGRAI